MNRASLKLTRLLVLFALLFISNPSWSQTKDFVKLGKVSLSLLKANTVTFKGNIKKLEYPSKGSGRYVFRYTDLLTGKLISVAANIDSSGSFNVKVPINGLQEVKLMRLLKTDDINASGIVEFSFYAKPGDDLELNFAPAIKFSERKMSFKGNLADLNNQNLAYQYSLDVNGFTGLIDYKPDSVTAENFAQYEKYVHERLRLALAYNARYFSVNKADPKLKSIADLNLRYNAANMLVIGAINANTNEESLQRFFKSNSVKINDSSAFFNSNYKLFVHSYYVKLTQDALKEHSQGSVNNVEMGAYLLKTHPELTEQDKELAKKMMDTVKKIQGLEKKRAIDELVKPYLDEYVASVKAKIIFDHLSQIENPAIREIFLTKQFNEVMDYYGVAVLKPVIEAYRKKVRPGKFRDQFLQRYESEYKRVFESKLSPGSILTDDERINPDSLVGDIKNKHKGKVIFIDVWATWCKPCLSEMANAKRLRAKLKGKEVVFVYLCISSKSKSQWKNLIASNKIEGDNYFLTEPQAQALVDQFYITTIPRYIIIDKTGNLKNDNAQRPGDVGTLKELESYL